METTGDASVRCFFISWIFFIFPDGFDLTFMTLVYLSSFSSANPIAFSNLRDNTLLTILDFGTLHALYIVIIPRSIRHSFNVQFLIK